MASNQVLIYYKKTAFEFALKNGANVIVIANDGSVYRDSILPENLIVNSLGQIGPAGGYNEIVKINEINTGAISNALEYTRRLAFYLIDQMNIQIGSDSWLEYIGKDIFGIEKLAGETDTEYSQRIVDEVFKVKCSPLAIQSILEPYADSITIIDGNNTGAFADVSFSDYYFDIDTPEIIRGALAGTNGGLAFHFRVLLENPDLSRSQKIINLINETKIAGTTYDLLII